MCTNWKESIKKKIENFEGQLIETPAILKQYQYLESKLWVQVLVWEARVSLDILPGKEFFQLYLRNILFSHISDTQGGGNQLDEKVSLV